MQNTIQQPQTDKKENLKLQSSVYPEGHGTMEHFNLAWKSIYDEAAKTHNDERHFKSFWNRRN